MIGGWLARLKNEKAPNKHAMKPTKPPPGEGVAGFVGFVAHAPALFQKIEEGKAESATDPDRCCWPHSTAMNALEIYTFMSRVARFTDKGMSGGDADRMADRLVIRDRNSDGRRSCLECAHLQGAVRCGNWLTAGVGREGLAHGLVTMLQRCGGYQELKD